MKKNLLFKGVAVLGAVLLLTNVFLPGLEVFASTETPATAPETPATVPETPATVPETPATVPEAPAAAPVVLATAPDTLSVCSNEVEYGSSKVCGTLVDAINNCSSGDTITLLKDIESFQGSEIRKNLTINLNGHDIKSDSSYIFDVYNNLNLEGSGNVVGQNAMIIWINHGNNPIVTIGENVVLNGEDGVGFWYSDQSCGATLNINGTIKSKNTSVTINGNIKDKANKSIINIGKTAKLEGDDVPLYLAGYGETTISDGAQIIGGATAIEVRAGNLTIDGGIFTANTNVCPVNISPNGNGSTTVGAALAIAQHTTKQDISVVVNGGEFNGCAALNQSNPQNNSNEDSGKVKTTIVNGTFNGVVSNADKNSKLEIKGGTFSNTVPSDYLLDDAKISVIDAEAKIGNVEYKTLSDAVKSLSKNASDITEILLLKNVSLSDTFAFNGGRKAILNLGGNTLNNDGLFYVLNGYLEIKNGLLKTSKQIELYGYDDNSLNSYLKIDNDAEIDSSTDRAITVFGLHGSKSYGAILDVEGKLNKNIFVSGNILEGDTTVNFKGTIDSDDIGIAQNGYSIVNIFDGAIITSKSTALEIRSGKLNINGGKLISTADSYSCNPNGNGTTTIGAALAVSQHTTKKSIEVNVYSGAFKGITALSLCNPQNNNIPVPVVNIKGGSFEGSSNSVVSTDDRIKKFVLGGAFSSEPDSDFISEGLVSLNYNDNTETPRHVGEKVTVTFDGNGGTVVKNSVDIVKGDILTQPANPTRSDKCYSFSTWNNGNSKFDFSTPVNENITLKALWNYTCSSSSGGGSGGGSSSSSSSSSSSKTTTTTNNTGLTNTGSTNTGSNTNSNTEEINLGGEVTEESTSTTGETSTPDNGYSKEFNDAYTWAFKNGITTMSPIGKADMNAPLTRIAMAKMLSQYAINVLGRTPDTTKVVPAFPDVSAELDAAYNSGVTLAYQLGIMGINVDKFRPNDLVTRAEFGTALSRMLYNTADGENAYYETHLAKLMEEKIITVDTPDLLELRGYVMIMLMRSANK